MSLPTGDKYSLAVQNPRIFFSDPDLRQGVVETDKDGLPVPYSGSFTTTYKVSSGKSVWAVRCFIREVTQLQQRYKSIGLFIAEKKPTYLVKATHVEKGVLIDGRWYPIIKMKWIEGDLLNEYVGKAIVRGGDIFENIAQKFKNLMEKMGKDGVIHGDLQHANIICKDDDFFLVDYDGLSVPELTGVNASESGHPNFQHPQRRTGQCDRAIDNFSAIVIYIALKALAIKPGLWASKYNNGDNLLFKKADFAVPRNSQLLYELSLMPELAQMIGLFVAVCEADLCEVPTLRKFIDSKTKLTSVIIKRPRAVNTGYIASGVLTGRPVKPPQDINIMPQVPNLAAPSSKLSTRKDSTLDALKIILAITIGLYILVVIILQIIDSRRPITIAPTSLTVSIPVNAPAISAPPVSVASTVSPRIGNLNAPAVSTVKELTEEQASKKWCETNLANSEWAGVYTPNGTPGCLCKVGYRREKIFDTFGCHLAEPNTNSNVLRNYALHMPTKDSSGSNSNGTKAVDDDTSTFWNVLETDQQWLEVLLLEYYSVERIELVAGPRTEGAAAKHGVWIRYGNGIGPIKVYTFSAPTLDNEVISHTFDPPLRDVSQVRIDTTSAEGPATWREVRVFGVN